LGERRRIASGSTPLLERDHHADALEEALAAAGQGGGSVVVIEGAAGIGKTRLLDLVQAQAPAYGIELLRANAAELERDYGWGVARQLFEPWLAGRELDARRRLLVGPAEPAAAALGLSISDGRREAFAAVHGLYWLCVNAAAERPLALVVDDLQWSDDASLSWLTYLAPRMRRLPMALVVAVRRPDPASAREPVGRLAADRLARVLTLEPLTETATAVLVRSRPALAAEADLVTACHQASAGNPFLLGALLDDLSEMAVQSQPDPAVVRELRPDEITRSVLLRLGRQSESARSVARAFAILGGSATVARVTELAALSMSEVVAAVAELAETGILTNAVPARFVHPVVHAVVLGDMPASVRALWHARAANALKSGGGTVEEIARQLLQTEPAADAAVTDGLAAAAVLALNAGAAQESVVFLKRAEREPPPVSEHGRVQRMLGRALLQSQGAVALPHLRLAVEAETDPCRRVEAAVELARALEGLSLNADATTVYARALQEFPLPDEDVRAALQAGLAVAAAQQLSTLPQAMEVVVRALSDAAGPLGTNTVMRSVVALAMTAVGSAHGVELAESLVADLAVLDADMSIVVGLVISPLVWGDRFELALDAWNQVIDRARVRGAPLRYAFAVTYRADVHLRTGRLVEAEADARAALGVPEEMWQQSVPVDTPALLAETLIQRGELDEAERVLADAAPDGEMSDYQGNNLFLLASGRCRLERGDPKGAAAHLLELGRRCEAFALRNPAALPWRSHAAVAIRHFDSKRASQLANEELELAREFGAPRALGIALRACGLVQPAPRGISVLREAVDVLEHSHADLELARALIDLGAAERRAGERVSGREHLAAGLDRAAECGARSLAQRGRSELFAAGARPRRDRVTSRDALTASELRVARMASDGSTNRQIAEALWVTLSTVEAHLSRAYRKLDISSRSELGEKLDNRVGN
jgi:DNA-binding CsgD family transcriptional regulator/tetratricopeptide (TPR) repeat protein